LTTTVAAPRRKENHNALQEVSEPLPRLEAATVLAHVLTWAVLAAGFTLLIVHYSVTRGKLIVPAHYDDVTYLRDGLSKLDAFYRGGLNGILGRAIDQPPHSPFSTLVAVAGYALFGIHDWSPYAANGIIIFGLLAFTDYLLRGVKPGLKLVAFLFVLTVPIAAQSIYEFRSDMAVGLMTASVIVLLLETSLTRSSAKYLYTVGVLIGLTLLAKTSIFPITLGLVGSALLATTVKDRVLLGPEARVSNLARAWIKILLPALFIPLPFYFRNRHEIFYYITVNALGSNSDIWKLHADNLTHALYYATGIGGSTMIGRLFVPMAAVLVIGAIYVLAQKHRPATARLVCYAFMLLVAYLGPTLNPIKDPFLAVSFDFLFIFSTLLVFRGLLSGEHPMPAILAKWAMVFLLIAGAWFAKWPMYWGERTRPDVVTRNRYMHDLYHGIRSHNPSGEAKVLVAVSGVFANADSFGYMGDKDGLTHLDFTSDFTNKSKADFDRELTQNEFVIIGDPGNPEDDPNVPYNQMLEQTLSELRSSDHFTLIATCPAFAGKNYYLYQRRSAGK
jgi:hypothetical protein